LINILLSVTVLLAHFSFRNNYMAAASEDKKVKDASGDTSSATPYTPVAPSFVGRGDKFVLSDNYESSPDPIRQRLSAYWISNGNGISFAPRTSSNLKIEITAPLDTFDLSQEIIISEISSFGGGATDVATGASGELGPTATQLAFDNLTQAIESVIDGDNIFQDFVTTLPRPVEYPSVNSSIAPFGDFMGDTDFIYNYGDENYEKVADDALYQEKALINFYSYLDSLSLTAVPSEEPTDKFERLSSAQRLVLSTATDIALSDILNMEDYYVAASAFENFQKLETMQNRFPFYTRTSITHSPAPPPTGYSSGPTGNDEVSHTMNTNSLKVDLMSYISDLETISAEKRADFVDLPSYTSNKSVASYRDKIENSFDVNSIIETGFLESIDFWSYSDEALSSGAITNSPRAKAFFGPDTMAAMYVVENLASGAPSAYSSGYGNAHSQLRHKLDELAEKYTRTYDQILDGIQPYSEVLFYKIEKYDPSSSTLLQNFWIPAPDTTSEIIINYIDSQVKYGKRYSYSVYAYKLVLGCEYKFFRVVESSIGDPPVLPLFHEEVVNFYNWWQQLWTSIKAWLGTSIYYLIESDTVLDEDEKWAYEAIYNNWVSAFWVLQDKVHDYVNAQRALGTTFAGVLTTDELDELELSLTLWGNAWLQYKNKLDAYIELAYEYAQTSVGDSTEEEGLTSISGERYDQSEDLRNAHDMLFKQMEKTYPLWWEYYNLVEELYPETSMLEVASSPRSKSYKVAILPSFKLLKIPVFEDFGTILDNPPIYPNVNIVTYAGISQYISPFLNSAFGEVKEFPVILDDSEATFYSLFREARKINSVDPILFKTDEFENLVKKFEVYRLDKKPVTYYDFRNNKRAEVETLFDDGRRPIPSASLLELIQPNKKYYYMFRGVDRRGIPSTPSAVYEIEMVDIDGIIFPLIQIVDMGLERILAKNKSGRRLLSVVPRISQVMPRYSTEYADTYKTGADYGSLLGSEAEPLFGNSFKIRLTSKKTGKMIDLNIAFNTQTHELPTIKPHMGEIYMPGLTGLPTTTLGEAGAGGTGGSAGTGPSGGTGGSMAPSTASTAVAGVATYENDFKKSASSTRAGSHSRAVAGVATYENGFKGTAEKPEP